MELVPRVTLTEATTFMVGGRFTKRIPFTATLTPSRFAGRVVLTWNDAEVKVFPLARGGRELTSGHDLAATYWKNSTSLYAEPVAASAAAITLSLPAPGDGNTVVATNAAATLTIVDIGLSIKAEDGLAAAATTVVKTNRRKFKAMLTRTGNGEAFQWTRSAGAGLFDHLQNRAEVTVTPKNGGAAEVSVTATILGRQVTAAHQFTIAECAILDGDGVKTAPGSILRGVKHDYKAVTTPSGAGGAFAWTVEGGNITTGASTTAAVVEVTGNNNGGGQKLKLAYSLGGQTQNVEHPLAVADIALVKPVVAVQLDRTNGSTAVLKSNAPGNAGHAWAITANGTEAEAEGATNEASLNVKATKTGVAGGTLTYTPLNQAAQTLEGAAVFVDAWLKSFTPENGTKVDLTTSSAATDKKAEVLLGLTNDPAAWKLGHVLIEAEGAPASIDTCGVQSTGTYAWKPSTHVIAAAAQPSGEHGAAKPAILMTALPAANGTGPSDAADQDVEVTYKLHDLEVKDKLVVCIRTVGCSCVKWRRKGASVTAADRPLICGHGTTEQRSAFTNTLAPSGGISDIAAGGHQHGGRCLRCSVAGRNRPRTVYHYVNLTTAVLAEARALAKEICTFENNNSGPRSYTNSQTRATQTLLTAQLKRYLRIVREPKMLGVMRGTGARGTRWLYAVSGNWWDADGDWCAPINAGWRDTDTRRTIRNYAGNDEQYVNNSAPFNTRAMTARFGKLGICAAPKLLNAARVAGLVDLELAEVWLDLDNPSSNADDPQEIGSCEQCRRILGRMLCEVGG
jgi:hypothetical protein